ncbi:hypothetical protein [Neolewinella aurantiaca]|nr:hypothetical protein [Neolewinella aurantiaca]
MSGVYLDVLREQGACEANMHYHGPVFSDVQPSNNLALKATA